VREALASVLQLAGLIGLGIFFYGGMIYPPLAWPMALLNLAFILACVTAVTARRIELLVSKYFVNDEIMQRTDRRDPEQAGQQDE